MNNTILVTAIGSFSANCVISSLKKNSNKVIGCDIYPSEWHHVSKLCDKVYRAPVASEETEYIDFILSVSKKENVGFVMPLTDLEIDILNKNRNKFLENDIILCMPSSFTLSIARDKYNLYKTFENDPKIPSIKTYKTKLDVIPDIIPCIAKPCNGRSSEGLRKVNNIEELHLIKSYDNYIIQDYITGSIFTVDYVRNAKSGNDFCISREELLRTKNGAGTTVKITDNKILSNMAYYIGNKIQVNGAINMEFIKYKNDFYLIDINPRFSAGVAFTVMAGYNIVISHLNCFNNKDISQRIEFSEQVMTKKYVEEIL